MTMVSPIVKFPYLSYLISAVLMIVWIQQKIAEIRNEKRISAFLSDAVSQLKGMILQQKQCSKICVVLIDEKYYEDHLAEEMKQVHIELRPLVLKNLEDMQEADAVLVELNAFDAMLVQKIRYLKQNVPIYGITKSENWEELIKAMETGLNGTLGLPLHVSTLAEVIERTI